MNFDARQIPPDAVIGSLNMHDGWPVRTLTLCPKGQARGTILFAGGRGDFFEKYLEAFGHWRARGWRVFTFDWRGQGGSGRIIPGSNVGHIDDFGTWLDDLAKVAAAQPATDRLILMGHSMGGHLVLRALVDGLVSADRVLLSAPMLGFDTPPLSDRAAGRLARLAARWLPDGLRAWPDNERPALPGASRAAFLTNDARRYADELWWRRENPSLALGPPSWQWLAAAYASCAEIFRPGALEQVAAPVLLLGTRGDRLVSPAAIERAAARLPQAELVMLGKDVAHEMLREVDAVRTPLLERIDAFVEAE